MSALVDIGSDQPFHPWDQVVANVDVDADHALADPPFRSALSGRSKSIPKSTPLRIGQALQSRSRPFGDEVEESILGRSKSIPKSIH